MAGKKVDLAEKQGKAGKDEQNLGHLGQLSKEEE